VCAMEKKNFLFVSLTGLISDIAWQVSKEGHEVRYFIGDKKEKDIADGFVAKSKGCEKDVERADVVIFAAGSPLDSPAGPSKLGFNRLIGC